MVNWDEFAATEVWIECADLGKMNKIRAWARKNRAIVKVSRYAKDAYAGSVKIYLESSRDEQQRKAQEVRQLIKSYV